MFHDSNSTEVDLSMFNWKYVSFGLDNGLVPNRRQTIFWINDGGLTNVNVHWPASVCSILNIGTISGYVGPL